MTAGLPFALPAVARSEWSPRDLCSVRGRLASRYRPCPRCGRWTATTSDGFVLRHGPRVARCLGTGRRGATPWTTVRPSPAYL